jgi:predicted amidohydrolase
MMLYTKRCSAIGLGLLAATLSWADVKPIDEVFEPSKPTQGSYDKVAVVAWNSPRPSRVGISPKEAESIKASNREQIAELVREAAAAGARFVVTPEFAVVGYPDIPELPDEEDNFRNPADLEPYVEAIPGTTTNYFAKLARELKIYLQVGFAERGEDSKFYNAAVVLDPSGKIIARFRKINLYQKENDFLSPGKSISTFESPWGRVGLTICADIYSSFPMRDYSLAKTDVIALSTSWAQYNTGMKYFRDAARRYKFYVLAANQTYFPDSGVVNPDGSTQSHIRQSSGIAYGYLPVKNTSLRPRSWR